MTRYATLKRVGILAAIIIVAGYALFEARGLLRGPVIEIESPAQGATITEGLIRVVGRATNAQSVTMNDRTLLLSDEGRIDEPVALLPGYNIIVFLADDRFGNTARVDLALLYRPDHAVLPAFSFPVPGTASSSAETAGAAGTNSATSTP